MTQFKVPLPSRCVSTRKWFEAYHSEIFLALAKLVSPIPHGANRKSFARFNRVLPFGNFDKLTHKLVDEKIYPERQQAPLASTAKILSLKSKTDLAAALKPASIFRSPVLPALLWRLSCWAGRGRALASHAGCGPLIRRIVDEKEKGPLRVAPAAVPPTAAPSVCGPLGTATARQVLNAPLQAKIGATVLQITLATK